MAWACVLVGGKDREHTKDALACVTTVDIAYSHLFVSVIDSTSLTYMHDLRNFTSVGYVLLVLSSWITFKRCEIGSCVP